MAESSKENSYEADDIQVLEGLEPVRKRPGMYVGGTGNRSLQHLLHEIVDNSIDEALAGHCKTITVTLKEDGVMEVIDDGRGIPPQEKEVGGKKMSTIDVVFMILHAGGKFGGGGYKVSGGLHGVGASVTNALSAWLEVEVRRADGVWQARYERGTVAEPAKRVRAFKKGSDEVGTTVRWRYDDKDTYGDKGIFAKGVAYDPSRIEQYLREKAYLVPGLTFRLNLPGKRVKVFKAKNGIADMVSELNKDRSVVHTQVVRVNSLDKEHRGKPYVDGDVAVEYALQWTEASEEHVHAFANIVNTPGGGTHVAGMRRAVTRALNTRAYEKKKLKKGKKNTPLEGRDVFDGLTVVLSVQVPEPQFEGQTKDKLGNPEVEGLTQSFVYATFTKWLAKKENADMADAILERALLARDVRVAARKASKKVRNAATTIIAGSNLPGKLADCHADARPVEEKELLIVEGDSAAGSAKSARDNTFQAVLPIRGKIMNAVKDSKPLDNAEIESILIALGGRKEAVGRRHVAALHRDTTRYGKVIVLADADDDGAHIAMLLLAMFHELFARMLREGRVFLAKPPLHRATYAGKDGKRKAEYAYSDEELTEILKRHPKAMVQRFKGLGEMDPEHLRETCLDPKTRELLQVKVEDTVEAQEVLTLLMGRKIEPRKKWLGEVGLGGS